MPSFLDFQHGTSVELAYANKYSMAIEFTHLPSALSVRFKAYITNWADSFQSSYNSAQVYGRNDPIMTFQGTQRTISLSWKVIAADIDEAINNVERINRMAKFLYPGYETNGVVPQNENIRVGTLAKAPLLKVRFANLVKDGNGTITEGPLDSDVYDQGLVVALGGLDISMELDDGGFDAIQGNTIRPEFNGARAGGVFFPKTFTLSTTMTVLHQHNVGWDESGNWMGPNNYPYDAYAGEEGTTTDIVAPSEPDDDTAEGLRFSTSEEQGFFFEVPSELEKKINNS